LSYHALLGVVEVFEEGEAKVVLVVVVDVVVVGGHSFRVAMVFVFW
jgi:hypothetical protein